VENRLTVDERGFRAAMEEAAERSRASSGFGKLDNAEIRAARKALDELRAQGELPERGVKYDPYAGTRIETQVAGLLSGEELVASVRAGDQAQLILPETCFYVESGGQLSDTGRIVHAQGSSNGSGAWSFVWTTRANRSRAWWFTLGNW